MQIQVSEETADEIERLMRERAFSDAQSVVEAAVAEFAERDHRVDEHARARIESALESIRRNGGHPLTPQLVEDIKRRGRERLAGK